MLQMMTNASNTLLQLWGAVQYVITLYSLARDYVITVNCLHFSGVTQVLSQYNRPIPWEWKCKQGFTFHNPPQDRDRVSRSLSLKLRSSKEDEVLPATTDF